MSSVYPPESRKLDVISHLEELRKRILLSLLFLAVFTALSFVKGDTLMRWITEPARGYVNEMIFISPTEGFMSFLKVAMLFGLLWTVPFITFQLWAFLSPAFGAEAGTRILLWLTGGFFLFYAGVLFSYFLAIPAAVRFLLSFGSQVARANISIGKYVSFTGALILVGGIVFEIPVLIGLFTDIGVVKASYLRAKRHYAILAIMIFAAVITPTQDIMNMLVFAVPMMLLFEIGIIISSIIEKRRPENRV